MSGLFAPLKDHTRWALWLPVAIAAGIAIYFSLPAEPPLWAGIVSLGWAVGLLILHAILRRYTQRHELLLWLACWAVGGVALGFAAGVFRTASIAHVVLPEQVGPLMVRGTVMTVEDRGDTGIRLILDRVDLWRYPLEKTPPSLRLTVRTGAENVVPGDLVSVRAALSPPPRPVYPGGYDFARSAYFNHIGAVGYATGPLRVLQHSEAREVGFRRAIERHRHRLTERIYAALEGDPHPSVPGIAAALLTGEVGRIEKADLNSLRASGLGHILSISGLHMVLVTSIAFVGLRWLLALIPALALRFPIKKWAAAASIVIGAYYLMISGLPTPAERSYIMVCFYFIAVLCDRLNTPMRPIALAAALLLLLLPESLLDPSFQMSFAAVIGLCAYFQKNEEEAAPLPRWDIVSRITGHLWGIAMASVVASLATAPFGFYHFGQFAVYGLLANMFAIPLASILIMPAGFLALVLMLLGLEKLPLLVMAKGIDGMMAISDLTGLLPFSMLRLPHLDIVPLVLIVLGGLWICLWQQRVRWFGVVPLALGILLFMISSSPNLVLDERGRLYAIRDEKAGMAVPSRVYARYARDYWMRAYGLDSTVRFDELPRDHPLYSCTSSTCHWQAGGLKLVRGEACEAADLMILTVQAECPLAGRLITPGDLKAGGTHAIWVKDGQITVRTVTQLRGRRGWTQP